MVFLGIDVSKGRLDCAVLAAEGGRPLGRRSFRNDAEGAERAATWTTQVSGAAAAGTRVILEATAAYHEPVAHRLAAFGMRVSIVNPAQVRSFAKGIGVLGKTDRIDAQLLARYGQLARPRVWLPPARALLDPQGLLARLDDIEADLRREGNRLEQARTRGCPDVVEQSLLASLAALESSRETLRRAIVAHVAAHGELQADLERLLTIPTVGPKTAVPMLAMLRARGFDSARQAAAYLGLVPVERQSGKSVRGRPRLSRAGNPRLRAALYMAAVVGIRRNPDLKAQHERLLGRGKCKMAALSAAMRKLVHLCFGVLKGEGGYRLARPHRLDSADGIYIKVQGRWCYLYRAIDRSGALVDVMFSEHRDMAAAEAFFRSAKAVTSVTPDRVTTDGHDSYPRAIRTELGRRVRHRTSRYLNNRLEQDHRGIEGRYRPMRGFKCPRPAARFCRGHDELRDFLRLRSRHHRHVPADRRRLLLLRRTVAVLGILEAA